MNARERFVATMHYQPRDRCPIYDFGFWKETLPVWVEQGYPNGAKPGDYFGMDLSRVTFNPTTLPRSRFAEWLGAEADAALASGEVDEWGVWRRQGGFHHFAHRQPTLRGIQELARLRDYPWPDLDQPARFQGVAERIQSLHAEGLAVIGYAGSVFERSWYLRGIENLMMDLLAAPEIAEALFERTAAFQLHAARQFARAAK